MLNAPFLAPSVQASGSPSKEIEAVPGHVRGELGQAIDRFALVDAEIQMQAVLVLDLAEHGAMQRVAALEARGVPQVLFFERRRRGGFANPPHQIDVGEDELDELADLPPQQLADTVLDSHQPLPHPDRQSIEGFILQALRRSGRSAWRRGRAGSRSAACAAAAAR